MEASAEDAMVTCWLPDPKVFLQVTWQVSPLRAVYLQLTASQPRPDGLRRSSPELAPTHPQARARALRLPRSALAPVGHAKEDPAHHSPARRRPACFSHKPHAGGVPAVLPRAQGLSWPLSSPAHSPAPLQWSPALTCSFSSSVSKNKTCQGSESEMILKI